MRAEGWLFRPNGQWLSELVTAWPYRDEDFMGWACMCEGRSAYLPLVSILLDYLTNRPCAAAAAALAAQDNSMH